MTSQPFDSRPLDGEFARQWVTEFVSRFTAEMKLLADLDRQAGDGDFGTNLASALGKTQGFIDGLRPQTFSEVFHAVSKGFLITGGTSGPLFGMCFREIAKAAETEPVDVKLLADGVTRGLAVIQRLGGASVGDNTMVDAIAPAARALRMCAADGAAGVALSAAARAAQTGAESTRDLVASRGRASYVGEVARGVLDPGAVAVALFFSSAVVMHGEGHPSTSWLRNATSDDENDDKNGR
jgi:dihydroxyacetone kinase-like protein